MNEQEFISQLSHHLRKLPVKEREEILDDYRRHFSEGRINGFPDYQIATSLGDPRTIANEYLVATIVYGQKDAKTPLSRLILKVMALGFIWIIFLFPVMIAIWSVLFSLMVSGLGLMIYGPVMIGLYYFPGVTIYSTFSGVATTLLLVGGSLLGVGLFGIFLPLTIKFTKIFALITKVSFVGGKK